MPDETLSPENAIPVDQAGPEIPSSEAPVETVREPTEEVHANPTTLSEYLESLLVTVILALFGTSFVVQAFKIPSQSMEKTLLVGDHLLVNKFVFGGRGAWYDKYLPYRPLERGDIIVFKFPYQDHPHFVKRVIGLPGDTVAVQDGFAIVNGKKLVENYVPPDYRDDRPYSPTVVPPDDYFVLGDHRISSNDSRAWGFVPRSYIYGKAVFVFWPLDRIGSVH